MKTYAVVLAALISGSAHGACENVSWGERPDIPDGREASFDEMIEAREEVTDYVETGKAYLECFEPEPFVHNYIVGRLERVAGKFNRERERFLEQRAALAAN